MVYDKRSVNKCPMASAAYRQDSESVAVCRIKAVWKLMIHHHSSLLNWQLQKKCLFTLLNSWLTFWLMIN